MLGAIRPLEDSYASTLAPRRFTMIILTTFAAFGVVLAGVWVITALILGAAGLVAAWVPARRASRVNPAVTLRAE